MSSHPQVFASLSGAEWDYYAHLEVKQRVNAYYQKDDPKSHASAAEMSFQVGKRFYGGKLDAYATFGVVKYPQTQQLVASRPQFEVDYYPVELPYFVLRQYNLFLLGSPPERYHSDEPLSEADHQSTDVITEGKHPYQREGGVYLPGFNPVVRIPWNSPDHGNVTFSFGVDAWTYFYSQPQMLQVMDSESGWEEREDSVQRYGLKPYAGVEHRSSRLNQMLFGLQVYYLNQHYPYYVYSDGDLSYRYKASRNSYYRLRLRWDVSERVTLVNDFYHYQEGFFAARRSSNEKRYRNLFRLVCTL